MKKSRIVNLLRQVLVKDSRLVFAYAYGSFVTEYFQGY